MSLPKVAKWCKRNLQSFGPAPAGLKFGPFRLSVVSSNYWATMPLINLNNSVNLLHLQSFIIFWIMYKLVLLGSILVSCTVFFLHLICLRSKRRAALWQTVEQVLFKHSSKQILTSLCINAQDSVLRLRSKTAQIAIHQDIDMLKYVVGLEPESTRFHVGVHALLFPDYC